MVFVILWHFIWLTIPRGTKFLREFNFAEIMAIFYVLRLEKTGFSCWELIFPIF